MLRVMLNGASARYQRSILFVPHLDWRLTRLVTRVSGNTVLLTSSCEDLTHDLQTNIAEVCTFSRDRWIEIDCNAVTDGYE